MRKVSQDELKVSQDGLDLMIANHRTYIKKRYEYLPDDINTFLAFKLPKSLYTSWDFSGLDFKGAILELADFSNSNLQGANLSGCDLNYTKFIGCNLQGANFTDSYLFNSDFRGADLKNTDFRGADLFGADMRDCDLTTILVEECKLENVELGEYSKFIRILTPKQTNLILKGKI